MDYLNITGSEMFIKEFRAGKATNLNILWHQHYKALVYFADQLMHNSLLSEDVVADTYVKVWKLREQFNNVHSIKAFLYITVRNTCFDLLRSQVIHTRIHQEIQYASDYYSAEMNKDDYDMMYAEYIQKLRVLVEDLPERCRDVFKLYFFNNSSTIEIAGLLNISEQTARNHKTRAIEILRNSIPKN